MAATDTKPRPLQLWPGLAIVAVQWLLRFVLPAVMPDGAIYGVIGGFAGAAALLVWWLGFSRAPWLERIGGVLVIATAVGVTSPFLHVSLATGAMGMLFPMLAIPGICLAFALWALLSRNASPSGRWMTLVLAMMLATAPWTLVRTGGFTASFDNDLSWRWTPSSEERLLAESSMQTTASRVIPLSATVAPPAPVSAPLGAPAPKVAAVAPAPDSTHTSDTTSLEAASSLPVNVPAEWPGFRGPARDGVVRGLTIDPDWAAAPPIEIWRRPIGPAWSSFSVQGDLFYTQEQRGDDEIVAAYRVSTGAPVWQHRDATRFWESNGGAGPRGTPTIHGGRIYALGATGVLNALDAATGRVVWSHNISADTKVRVPDWGFASSPLVYDDLVIVAAEGKLVAYDRATGASRWSGPDGYLGYSSPHLMTTGGTAQVLLLNGSGVTSVSPSDGRQLWERRWSGSAAASPIVQPALLGDGNVLLTDGEMLGTLHRIAINGGEAGWTVDERWESSSLKPFFNDLVIHKGHAYGYDGSILACIDLNDGTRKWKGGRYGNGQMLLLADQDLLLVVSEEGELALVSATPDKFTQLARVPAISGKTWNHPVVVRDVLLVRNGEEMAAFRLALRKP